MRKLILLLIFVLLPLNNSAGASLPDVEKYQWPPKFDTEKEQNRTTGYFWNTSDSFAGNARNNDGISYISVPGLPLCTGMRDPNCTSVTDSGKPWLINVVIDECTKYDGKYPCIEGVAIERKENFKPLDFVKQVPGNIWAPDEEYGLIPGGSASLWRDPEGSSDFRYLVIFSGTAGPADLARNRSALPLTQFQASIVPTKILRGDFEPDKVLTDSSGIRRWSNSAPDYCVWVDSGECGYRVEFPDEKRLQLSAKIPLNFGGFLIGRMRNAEVSIGERVNGLANLKVMAEPVVIPLLQSVIRSEVASQELVRHFNNPRKFQCAPGDQSCKKGLIGGMTTSSGDVAFEYYELFESGLNSKAALMMPTWSFRSHQTYLGRCSNFGIFQGLVATNSAIYQGDPPKLNNGELSYRVAGVRLDDKGNVFQGSYDLVLRSASARCIYKLENSPVQASISIENSQGSSLIKTTSFSERDGWIRMSANGFTFSQPIIKVKLIQKSTEASSETKPSVTQTPAPSPKAEGQSNKVITCVRGKVTKKVTGTSPKCPKGFKKK